MVKLDASSFIQLRPKKHAFDIAFYFRPYTFTKYCPDTQEVLYSKKRIAIQWKQAWIHLKETLTWPLYAPQFAFIRGALAFDANSDSTTKQTSTNFTWTHVRTGPDNVLTVEGGSDTVASDTYSITFAGQALTSGGYSNANRTAAIHYKIGGTLGSGTVSFTTNGATFNGVAGAVSFTGANAVQNANTNSGNSTNPNVNVSSASGNVVVAISVGGGAVAVPSGTPLGTTRWHIEAAGDIGGTVQSVASTGSSTQVDWAVLSSNWCVVGLDIVAGSQPSTFIPKVTTF